MSAVQSSVGLDIQVRAIKDYVLNDIILQAENPVATFLATLQTSWKAERNSWN